MFARSVDFSISTILSYSSDQDSYVRTDYTFEKKTEDLKKSAEDSSKEESAEGTSEFDLEKNINEILTPDQIRTFEQLINNLALEYLLEFAAKAKEDNALGKKLDSVHILNTFEFFLSNADRKTKIRQIFDKKRTLKVTLPFGYITEVSFKAIRAKSINGFCDVLKKSHNDKNILTHLPSFAKKLNKDERYAIDLTALITNGKYQDFFNKVLLED